MKKMIAILGMLLLVFSLVACTRSAPSKADLQAASVTTSFVKEAQLYLPNENVDGFVLETEECDGNLSTIVDMLVGRGAIPDGSEANFFEPDGQGGAVLDMNAFYGSALSATGTTGEYMMLGSLVNTILKTYELERLRLTVDGKDLETGHDVYDYDLTFYENQVSESACDDAALLWERLNGYWNAAQARFVHFAEKEGEKLLEYGMWETDFGSGTGTVSELSMVDAQTLEATVQFPAYNGTDPYSAVVQVDCSGLEQDGKLRMSIDMDDAGAWKQYAFAGTTPQAAMQTLHGDGGVAELEVADDTPIATDPWTKMTGYWNAADGYFVNFGTRNGARVLDYGIWNTSFGRGGSVMEFAAIDSDTYEIAVYCPALPATEMDDAVAEKTVIVQLDASGLERDGKVRLCIDDGDWSQYTFAGTTMEEALAAADGGSGAVGAAVLSADAFWEKATGFWISQDDYVVAFTVVKNNRTFLYGSQKTNTSDQGTVSSLKEAGENVFELKVPLNGGTAGKIGKQKAVAVQIDAGSLASEKMLSVKVGSEVWREYLYAGSTLTEAAAFAGRRR